MPNTIAIRRRISSVKNTRQITKALELVSASKMRRAQERAKLSRAYQDAAYALLARLSSLHEIATHPLFERRKVKARLYIVISSNSGLAGAYNYNVFKVLTTSAQADQTANIKSNVITIGKQAAQFVRRLQDIELLAVYNAFDDQPTANDIRPILNTLIAEYREKKVDEVFIIYTVFKSNFVQQAVQLSLLPAQNTSDNTNKYKYSFTNFEPTVSEVLANATTRLIEVQLWQALLESLASEHSMRMVAMKNATDNANNLIDDLTLEFNTARQASITQELAEITGGAEAINND